MDWEFILNWIKVVIIDFTLAGDNALVIAMAVLTLPPREQRRGIIWGAVGAVLIRVIITFVAAQILQLPLLQLGGGLLLIWVAFKLLRQGDAGETKGQQATTILGAVWIIIVADLIMSTDNILAVAGASQGNVFLLLFGLGLSIPIVVVGAAFIARLMNRFGWLVFVGAGILGEVSAKMMLDDQFIQELFGEVPKLVEYGARAGLAASIVLIGIYLSRKSTPVEDSQAIELAAPPHKR
jgi:YjbE family integral membrane protein